MRYKCPRCGFGTDYEDTLARHIRNTHGDDLATRRRLMQRDDPPVDYTPVDSFVLKLEEAAPKADDLTGD